MKEFAKYYSSLEAKCENAVKIFHVKILQPSFHINGGQIFNQNTLLFMI